MRLHLDEKSGSVYFAVYGIIAFRFALLQLLNPYLLLTLQQLLQLLNMSSIRNILPATQISVSRIWNNDIS